MKPNNNFIYKFVRQVINKQVMKIKIIVSLLIYTLLANINLFSQTFPLVIYNSISSNINIRVSASTSSSIITQVAPGSKLVANSQSGSWYSVSLPNNATGGPTSGWVMGGAGFMLPDNNNHYIEVTGNNVMMRMSPGSSGLAGTAWIYYSGFNYEYASSLSAQRFAYTGTSQVSGGTTWYEIYLPNNAYQCINGSCSVSGDFSSISRAWMSGQFVTLVQGNNCTPVSISSHPVNQNVSVGGNANFSIAVSGTPPYNYTWYKNSSIYSSTNNSNNNSNSITINSVTTNNNGDTYHCIVTNCNSQQSQQSNSATIQVSQNCLPVAIISNPSNITATSGSTAAFSVIVSGTGPFTYSWYKNYNLITTINSSSSSNSYTTPVISPSDNGSTYYCQIENCPAPNQVNSALASLTVTGTCIPVTVSMNPSNVSTTLGGSATFSISVNGTSPFTYQWRKSGVNLFGATSSSLTIGSVQLSDNNSIFDCVIKNCNGQDSIISQSASLAVSGSCTPVSIATQPQSQVVSSGSSVTFSVAPSGTSPFQYQWRVNGNNIPGATSSNYSISSVSIGENGKQFSCLITNCTGSNILSNNATLTVQSGCLTPTFTTSPNNSIVTETYGISFTATVSGSTPITFQWQKFTNGVWSNFSSSPDITMGVQGNTGTLTLSNLQLTANGMHIRALASNSCAANVISQSATLTVNPHNPHTILHIHAPFDATNFPASTLQSFTSNSIVPIEVAADGSDASIFEIQINSNINLNQLRLRIKGDPLGNLPAELGSFVGNPIVSGNKVTFKYRHPSYLGSAYLLYRQDRIEVYTIGSGGSILFEFPIHIYRPPVLFIHGLWGSPGAFKEMLKLYKDKYYPSYMIQAIDYQYYHDNTLADNAAIVPNEIRFAIKSALHKKISCSRVDLVGHSMGGLLSRDYLQSPKYDSRQDINKLITINTPHSGSGLANLLISNSLLGRELRLLTSIYNNLEYTNHSSVFDGAINDLAKNSFAMRRLNTTSSGTLNRNIVPTAVIASDWSPTEIAMKFGSHFIFPTLFSSSKINEIYSAIFQSNHDGVVSRISQSGGISYYLTPNNSFHTDVTADYFVINKCKDLLCSDPKGNAFVQTGFNPEPPSNIVAGIEEEGEMFPDLIERSIYFNSPFSGDAISNDVSVQVSISATPNINRVVISNVSSDYASIICDTTIADFSIPYVIPPGIYGPLKFIVIGFQDSILIDYDTVTVYVPIMIPLDSIKSDNDTLYIAQNQKIILPIKGYFGDSLELGLASFDMDSLSFVSLSTNIVKISSSLMIEGVSEGETDVVVTYRNKLCSLHVIVMKVDTGFVYSDPATDIDADVKSEEEQSITLYPNPAESMLYIKIGRAYGSTIEYSIFDIYGKCQFQSSFFNNEASDPFIDVTQINYGVYFVSLKTDLGIIKLKFSITR